MLTKGHLHSSLAILASVLMLILVFAPIVDAGYPDTETQFMDGSIEKQVKIPAKQGGSDNSTAIIIPRTANVTRAVMNVTGMPFSPNGFDYPKNVSISITGDSDIEWQFRGDSYGMLGLQNTFTGEQTYQSIRFGAPGSNSSTRLRLPRNATVDSVSMSVSAYTRPL